VKVPEGRKEGRREGRKDACREGRCEGMNEGRKEGRRQESKESRERKEGGVKMKRKREGGERERRRTRGARREASWRWSWRPYTHSPGWLRKDKGVYILSNHTTFAFLSFFRNKNEVRCCTVKRTLYS
jgi:hypothetical protein